MEDKTPETTEDENLNWSEEKTTYTKEEVETMKKKLSWDHEKWVQQVISEKKNYQSAMAEIAKMSKNPDKKDTLISLYDEHPEVAKIILDTVYDWQDIEAFKEAIWYKEDMTDPKVIEKLVSKQAQQIAKQNLIKDKKNSFIGKLKMEWDELKNFEEEFSERMQLKSFNINDIDKHLEKSFREVSDNDEMLKALKSQEIIGKAMATGEWKGWSESKKPNSIQKESNDFLKKMWII